MGGMSTAPGQIQGRFEGMVSMTAICVFPTLMYLSSHLEVIFQSEHFWSLQLLWSLPVLFICLLPRLLSPFALKLRESV